MSSALHPVNPISFVHERGWQTLEVAGISIDLVGGKAFGLSCLPPAWTLPYFVIASDLAKTCITLDAAGRASLISAWAEYCRAAAKHVGIADNDSVLVRSSAIKESITERGKFHSVSGSMADVVAAISGCIEKIHDDGDLRDELVCLVIQKELKPISAKGHLSNERRCYEEARDWLGEFEAIGNSPEKTFRINLRRWRKKHKLEEHYGPLTCNLSALVEGTLETVAAWAYLQEKRVHFEWVWDGQNIFIVQADSATQVGGVNPKKDPNFSQRRHSEFNPKCVVPITKEHAKTFQKIHNVFTYLDLNLPITKLYALDDENVLNRVAQNDVPRDLRDDLAELVKGSLVIRMDLETDDKNSRQLLPRTHEVRNVDDATKFLVEQTAKLRKDGVTERLVFIFHNFIPAVTSAFAYAAPGQRKVLIESLWGLPEGLYYNSHDKVTVDTIKPRVQDLEKFDTQKFVLDKSPRFKHFFVAPDESGKWINKTAAAPCDWLFSISKEDWIREIALNSRKIAEKEMRPLSIMWFVDVPKWASTAPVFPWHHEEFDYSQVKQRRTHRAKTPFDETLVIKTSEDVHRLQHEANLETSQVRQVKIQPKEDALLRDKKLLQKVGELAKKIKAVILLEGSTLSHAYYQLMQTHAVVEVAYPFDDKEDIREFNKLVRDKIPGNIQTGGEKVQISKLNGELLLRALRDKLVEEAIEVLDAGNRESILEELADVSEVIDGIIAQLKAKRKDVQAYQKTKREKAGGFEHGYVLLETSNPSPNVSMESGMSLSLDLGDDERSDAPSFEELVAPPGAPPIEKWVDRREHENANELLLNVSVPVTRDQWMADSAEVALAGKVFRARIKGGRKGGKIHLELSLFIQPQQLDLF
jgi:predicted house-cleaning noncanonical NTP pyrophosphatase (MazG superfamily)